MTDEKISELVATHREILVSLRDITKDHEKRLRIVEKVVYGLISAAALLKIAQQLHVVV